MSTLPQTRPDADPVPSVPTPMCLLYTLLRHGHGLSHEEALRRANAALEQIPAQAC